MRTCRLSPKAIKRFLSLSGRLQVLALLAPKRPALGSKRLVARPAGLLALYTHARACSPRSAVYEEPPFLFGGRCIWALMRERPAAGWQAAFCLARTAPRAGRVSVGSSGV